MAWGVARGVDDIVDDLRSGRRRPSSLAIMRQRVLDRASVAALCATLTEADYLEELSVTCHTLDTEMVGSFARMLARNSSIRRVAIGDSTLGDAGLRTLAPGIAASASLEHLDLSRKGLGPEGAEALASALRAPPAALVSLDLSGNGLGAAGVRALAGALGRLETLRLADAGLADGQGPGLALRDALRGAVRIGTLDVSGLGLTSPLGEREGGEGDGPSAGAGRQDASADVPATAPSSDAQHLAEALSALPALREVTLDSSAMPRACLESVLAGLLESRTLTSLSVGATPGAPASLASVLGAGTRAGLRRLLLPSCSAPAADVERLAVSLAAGPAGASPAAGLIELDLSGSTVCPAAAARLVALERLEDLHLHACSIDGPALRALLPPPAGPSPLDDTLSDATPATAGAFPRLVGLDLSANRLARDDLLWLLESLARTPSHLPSLRTLIVAANPGLDGPEADLVAAIETLAEARPTVTVVKTATDAGDQDGPPPSFGGGPQRAPAEGSPVPALPSNLNADLD